MFFFFFFFSPLDPTSKHRSELFNVLCNLRVFKQIFISQKRNHNKHKQSKLESQEGSHHWFSVHILPVATLTRFLLCPGEGRLFAHSLCSCHLLCFPSKKAMPPHSSTLAWKIPWTEEPGGLQSMGSLRVGHD